MDLRTAVRDIPDFPVKGVLFRDITPILLDPEALVTAVDAVVAELKDIDFDLIAGPESRGFIFGVPSAYNLKKGFIPIRKIGKLPYKCKKKEYDLEYGTAIIEMHEDAIVPGQKIVLVDDLLATGGTAKAIIDLVEEAGGVVVGLVFLMELVGLGGSDVLKGYDVRSILKY